MFLLDGLAICCKAKARGGAGEYRFKEKINMRKAGLTDLDDADGEWIRFGSLCGGMPLAPYVGVGYTFGSLCGGCLWPAQYDFMWGHLRLLMWGHLWLLMWGHSGSLCGDTLAQYMGL